MPDDIVISADERALQQILVNLLQNAVKFTPEGGLHHGAHAPGRRRHQHLRRGYRHRHPERRARRARPAVRAGRDRILEELQGLGPRPRHRALARRAAWRRACASGARRASGTIVLVHLPTAETTQRRDRARRRRTRDRRRLHRQNAARKISTHLRSRRVEMRQQDLGVRQADGGGEALQDRGRHLPRPRTDPCIVRRCHWKTSLNS